MSNIQNAKRVVSSFCTEYESGHPMFTDEDIETMKWLLQQAKKLERLKILYQDHSLSDEEFVEISKVHLKG